MSLKKIKNYLTVLAAGTILFAGSKFLLNNVRPAKSSEDNTKIEDTRSEENCYEDTTITDPNDPVTWVESKGWKITSYGHANETLYDGEKIEVFNKKGELLGFYKKDFLPHVKMNGSGVGDGIGNDENQYLCYDYNVNDDKTHYLIDHTQGAYGNIIYNWLEKRPSVAVNPPLPQGTKIRFKNLNLEKELNHPWVKELLLSKTFHADDRFFLPEEERHQRKCDIYVGLILFGDYTKENYQALNLKNVTILIEQPSPDLNKDGVVNDLDLEVFESNWLKEDKTQYLPGDFNYDNIVNEEDRIILENILENLNQ